MNDRSKMAVLKWYLDFINADIDSLSIGDRAKLAAEIGAQLHPEAIDEFSFEPGSISEGIAGIIGPSLLKRLNLRSFQERLQDFFGFMMMNVERVLAYQKGDWRPEEKTDFFPALGAFSAKMTIRLGTQIRHERTIKTDDQGEQKRFYKPVPEAGEESQIALVFSAKSDEDTLVFHFIRALKGVPIEAFRRCEECGGWFVHLTQRKRTFCSNRCAARHGSRRNREKKKREDLAAYDQELAANAERAHKAYAKKVKKEHPRAIVKRRPIKHKTSI